ncbi:MAG: DUF4878 domain-containing protein [Myxococcota bacterium]
MRLSHLLLTALLLTAPLACSRDDPAATVKTFLTAVEEKDVEKAFGLFSRDSQKALQAYVDQAKLKSQGGDPRKEVLAEAMGAGLQRKILAVEVLKQDETSATVKMTDSNYQTQQMRLVKEDGAWRLTLETP